ncbi:beta strand repeat-containing protein [Picosynechococcus sp. PCC 8807]|uniref:beta strand repeat-containing protein n=1 Tax=Picosynechococcus sp. PCC 8807 TaxID=195248 RepID=UPI000ACD26D3
MNNQVWRSPKCKTPRKNTIRKLASPLVIAGLMAAGQFQLIPQAIAIGTAADTDIINKATATYNDPANPGVPLNAESNTVTVTVAEVAGLTNVPAGIVDENGGSINSNDIVNYDFLLTNTGNATNNIEIPFAAITNPDGNLSVTGFLVDLNNDGDFDDTGESNSGNPFTTDVTATGIAADASVKVRVVTTVNSGLGASEPVAIQLGNTPPNDNSAGTQNQSYDADGTVDDVFTTATTPVNGQREAAALQSSATSQSVTPLALATVLKTRAAYNPATPATTDDTITYRLDFRVESSSPNSSFTPTNLEGTTIQLSTAANGSNPVDVQRILVSDAIPENTELTNTPPTAPVGWKVVYSTSATTTRTVGGSTATAPAAAVWQTVAPASLASVERIGWIYVGPSNVADSTVSGPTLAAGSATTGDANGFRFQVVTSGLTAGGTIANIAQAFGETVGDPNNEVVYDESGDQNPNNFNDDDTPPDPTGTNYDPVNDTGVADPANQDTDNNNNNTGTGPEGEANVLAITPPGAILNGPLNQPGAVGPTNNNDDFVNKSSLAIEGGGTQTATPGQTFNPAPVVFNNTFQNPSSNAGELDTVRLLPLAPNNTAVPATNPAQEATDIPDGTRVTITVGSSSAAYDYDDATGYTYVASSGTGPNFDGTANTLKFDNISPGVSINYTVTIDLPAGSQLSADRFSANGVSRAGYSVPVVAFVDNNNSGAFEFSTTPSSNNDNVFNIKIDRLYLGHLALLKEQRVLDTDGTTEIETWTTGPINDVEPGQFIEYRISYVNFSTPSTTGSSGNVTLGISNLVITEDGTTGTFVAGGAGTANNWALPLSTPSTTHQQNTSATLGTLQYFNGVTNLGNLDPADGATVTRYVNSVGTLTPDTAVTPGTASTYQGSFIFRRVLN